MADMAREAVRDIDAISERLMAQGILKGRLPSAFVPVMGQNHRRRRKYGLE